MKTAFLGMVIMAAHSGLVAGDIVATNLDLMRTLSAKIGGRIDELLDRPGTVAIDVKPREIAWYVEGSIGSGVASGGRIIETADRATVLLEYGIAGLHVKYSDPRDRGFLGEEIVDRTVRVVISGRAVDRATGALLGVRDFEESITDTIESARIPIVENPNIPVTQSPIPGGGLFSSLVEPLAIVGSVAVAVFLLFHIRS